MHVRPHTPPLGTPLRGGTGEALCNCWLVGGVGIALRPVWLESVEALCLSRHGVQVGGLLTLGACSLQSITFNLCS